MKLSGFIKPLYMTLSAKRKEWRGLKLKFKKICKNIVVLLPSLTFFLTITACSEEEAGEAVKIEKKGFNIAMDVIGGEGKKYVEVVAYPKLNKDVFEGQYGPEDTITGRDELSIALKEWSSAVVKEKHCSIPNTDGTIPIFDGSLDGFRTLAECQNYAMDTSREKSGLKPVISDNAVYKVKGYVKAGDKVNWSNIIIVLEYQGEEQK